MDKEQIRQLIREELAELIATDRYTFQKSIQIFDGKNILLGRNNGTQIGTAADQKVALHGVTPTIQQSAIADPTGGGASGVDAPARTIIGEIIDALEAKGIIAS